MPKSNQARAREIAPNLPPDPELLASPQLAMTVVFVINQLIRLCTEASVHSPRPIITNQINASLLHMFWLPDHPESQAFGKTLQAVAKGQTSLMIGSSGAQVSFDPAQFEKVLKMTPEQRNVAAAPMKLIIPDGLRHHYIEYTDAIKDVIGVVH